MSFPIVSDDPATNVFRAGIVIAVVTGLYVVLRGRSSGRPTRPPSARAPSASSPRKPEGPQAFTYEELAKFTGADGGPVYVGVFDRVFEVDPRFYGQDAPYSAFAGRECTIPLATMTVSSDRTNIPRASQQLSEDDLGTAREWLTKFVEKYDEVGYVVHADGTSEAPAARGRK
eukprot:TRINITY_DN35259_c0_g1_i1.p1 TRINITY_DN35259_c0_g1~~TRINITY_DN35259_c0_g1_i1.p1  ORF type:complete len:173 (-),score=16.49 TRINITY_DN35259_c0_g1_i1:244-762(-)